jgi:pyridoxal phosphate enzyme (YggS family)
MVSVAENITVVRQRISTAAQRAGRDPASVRLIAVTKEAGIDQIREALGAGATEIGENRVRDALEKKRILDSGKLIWHMIGHLQSNKARDAVKTFSVIHSVDSVKLAGAVDRESGKLGKVQEILLEVNVSGEESKFGIVPGEIGSFLKETSELVHTRTLGLMTMAPFVDDAEKVRPYFRELRHLAERFGLKELSMGMTQDFEVAVEEGATMVRVGSAIFKA